MPMNGLHLHLLTVLSVQIRLTIDLINPRTVFKINDVTRFRGSVWTPMLII